MKQLKSILTLLILATTLACNSDDDSPKEFDGSIESLEDFFNPDLVDALENLGFIINEGDTPPDITGSYFSSPFQIQASTVPGDNIGSNFPDYTSIFSNQNNALLKIDFNGSGGQQTDEGFGSLIAGDNDRFSVYLKLTSQISGSVETQTAYAISGRLTTDGIEDFQLAILMLDDNGDPDEIYIENNAGRLFKDGNNFSEKIN